MAIGNNDSTGGSNDLHGVNGGNPNHQLPEMNANDPLDVVFHETVFPFKKEVKVPNTVEKFWPDSHSTEEDEVLNNPVQNTMNNPEVGVIPNTPDIPTQDANDFEAPEEPQIEIPIPTQPHTVPTQTHSSEPSIPTRKSTRSTTQPAWLKDFVIGKHRASMATKTKQPVYPLFHEKDFEAYPEEYVGSLAHIDEPEKIDDQIEKRINLQSRIRAQTVFYAVFPKSLGSFHNKEPDKDELYVDFSLIYFGVIKHHVNGNMVYLLVNKDAAWVRKWGQKGLHMDGKLLTIDDMELVFAIRSYWQLELVSVGIKVLETLEALRKSKSNSSVFRQSTSLLHIFEVSKFLLSCQYLNLTNPYKKKLQYFLGISLTYFDLVFPLDWRKLVSVGLISLKMTELSVKLLDEIILQYVDMKGDFTYWTIGRVMMICIGSEKSVALCDHIINKLQWNPAWKSVTPPKLTSQPGVVN
ncbi:uvrD-like Helicase, ATP-binding domain, P-loop containing nucleoside triphosphate hydrolase [Artemisia annua]|uniref:UvrD-like Helicase, ATP-binding domain, P-loop containing nucleoside triphosphate hydrolase n=1 Tax=Artemisia annua TaxID=35608 RepID=A0A2U1Q1Y9_ARTAN|nr:uvrD-like Helicase, ATP-binding domain, P-loop containing nucleoside triphosphate hydrolase [Artemisia annua]